MADRYWVGGGASTNWNATANTNWSDTDGGANNATAPGSGDVAIFNGNSGSGTSVLNTAFTIQNLNCTGYTGTLTHNGGVTLTLNTAAATTLFLSSTMTYTAASATSLITFASTSGANNDITTNGKRLGAMTFNGVGGVYRLLDALRVDIVAGSLITLTNGTFNANGFAVTTNTLSSSNANTRSLLLGGGDWTIGAAAATNTTIWNFSNPTGMTFTKGASNIIVPSNTLPGLRNFAGGSLTYNNLTIDSNSGRGIIAISGGNTFANLSVGAGNTITFAIGATNTISSAPTWTGTSSLPIAVGSGTIGVVGTISVPSGTLSLSYGAVRDITGSGGATFVANNSFDFGQNTGWAISPPAAQLTAADIRAAVGLASANLDTQLADLPTNAELATALVGPLPANIKQVNDVTVNGIGTAGNPWGP